MTAIASALPRPPRWMIGFLLKPGNWLPAIVWLFLVFNQALNSGWPPALGTMGLVLINSVAMVLFLARRDAFRTGGKIEGVIALSGTFAVSFLKDAEQLRDANVLPTAIQTVALIGWAISLAALGRSFGVVPADRGLVRNGPYRVVRHPIYAFEALFSLGFLMAVPTLRSAVIIVVWCALQVTRIVLEERIIAGYGEYRQAVRWRIIPGLW